MDRSAENERVGNITIAAWQMEDRADQRMAVGCLPDGINGRVRAHICSEMISTGKLAWSKITDLDFKFAIPVQPKWLK